MKENKEQEFSPISDVELMRKMMLFMRKAKAGGGGRGIPGLHAFPPFRGRRAMERRPEEMPEDGNAQMPPFGAQRGRRGMRRPPLTREHLLLVIAKYPEGVRQKALSEEIGINQSSTSELITKLESDGYIRRKVDPNDKRATLLFLTELGEARAAEIEDERKDETVSIFANLTDEEKWTLSGLLDKLIGTEEESEPENESGEDEPEEPEDPQPDI